MIIKKLFNNEKGLAMPLVVITLVVVTLLGLTSLFMMQVQTESVQRYNDSEDGLYYAEAGYNKYLWHLNDNKDFYKEGHNELDELELLNSALVDVNGEYMWVYKPVSFQDGYYQLRIRPPDAAKPFVTVLATGWPSINPSRTRTIEVQLNKRGFVQNVYVSNQETTTGDDDVWWIAGDVIHGPLHTNGILNITGNPIFHGPVTYTGGLNVASGSDPVYNAGDPVQVDPLIFPATNLSLKAWAESSSGHYYEGRTCIYLDGSNYYYRVKNGSKQGPIPLPPNGVIYVHGTGTSKWGLDTGNVFISGTLDGQLTVAAANDIYITHNDPTDWSEPASSAPPTGGITYANQNLTGNNITDDMLGLIAGRYIRILHHGWPRKDHGNWTSGINEYFRYNPCANNYSIQPYISPVTYRNVAPLEITIHGALFALEGTFEFEDFHADGPPYTYHGQVNFVGHGWQHVYTGSRKGTINLVGSIVQNNRGGVGTFLGGTTCQVTGYVKNYHHDPRMLYDTPPKFLEPVNSGWYVQSWRETEEP